MATYLVTQATGHQSQYTIKHLLAAGLKVHAIVRDPSKQLPEILNRPGVTIFKGESVNFDDVFNAAKGCEGVFLNTFPIPGVELQQAKTILEAAKKAGLKSVVASTVMVAGEKAMWDDDATKEIYLLDYFTSKSSVEDAVRGAGLDWTILRPAFCHFDYMLPGCLGNFANFAGRGELDHYYNDGARMPQTDTDDIGKYAAAALQDPAKFAGQTIDIASDNMTIEEVRDAIARVTGKSVSARKRTPEDGDPRPGHRFQMWANHKDLTGVMQGAKEAQAKFGIPFTPFEEALKRDKSRVLECLSAKA